MVTTITKNISEKDQVSALNVFFLVWVVLLTFVTSVAILWGIIPELI